MFYLEKNYWSFFLRWFFRSVLSNHFINGKPLFHFVDGKLLTSYSIHLKKKKPTWYLRAWLFMYDINQLWYVRFSVYIKVFCSFQFVVALWFLLYWFYCCFGMFVVCLEDDGGGEKKVVSNHCRYHSMYRYVCDGDVKSTGDGKLWLLICLFLFLFLFRFFCFSVYTWIWFLFDQSSYTGHEINIRFYAFDSKRIKYRLRVATQFWFRQKIRYWESSAYFIHLIKMLFIFFPW